MKPILYLDVDDTLIIWPPRGGPGEAAPGAADFFRWAMQNFEVRWLTMWAPDGKMIPERAVALAKMLNLLALEITAANNPHPFFLTLSYRNKSTSVTAGAIAEGREWAWVEDDNLYSGERDFVEKHADRYFETNVSVDPTALMATKGKLAQRFGLPL